MSQATLHEIRRATVRDVERIQTIADSAGSHPQDATTWRLRIERSQYRRVLVVTIKAVVVGFALVRLDRAGDILAEACLDATWTHTDGILAGLIRAAGRESAGRGLYWDVASDDVAQNDFARSCGFKAWGMKQSGKRVRMRWRS